MRHRRARLWIAVVASFGVYLVPLVGPHAATLVGEALVITAGGRSATWIAADVAVALAAQAVAGAVLYWSLGGGWLRKLAWLGAVPLVVALNVAYLSAIPSYFLIEADTAPELRTWAEHCFVKDAGLRDIRTSAMAASGPRTWWMSMSPDGQEALMRVPDCSLTRAALPKPGVSPEGYLDFFTSLTFASLDGVAIVEQTDRRTQQRRWSTLVTPDAPLHPIGASSDASQTPPALSRDGSTTALLQVVEGSGPPVLYKVAVRKAHPASATLDVDVDLTALGRGSYVIIDVDPDAQELLLWKDDRPIRVGFDGGPRPLAFQADGVRPQSSTYARVGDGWLVWDAYREDGPYQLAWLLGGRAGTHRTTTGRSVTSAAVDPAGRFIAVSETTTLSIGTARDVVYVLRADTGDAVFRVYLPRYSRSQVVFFDGGLFGYSDPQGTHILKLP